MATPLTLYSGLLFLYLHLFSVFFWQVSHFRMWSSAPFALNLSSCAGGCRLAQIRAHVARLEAEIAALTDDDAIAKARRTLRYWSTRQASAQLVDRPDGSAVAFGCTVTFRLNGTERCVTIVGDDEADPAAGLLAFSAPLSRALMGAEAGETVDFGGKPGAIAVLAITVATG